MRPITPCATIDEAWLSTLETMNQEPEGQAVHVVTTIERPVVPDLHSINSDDSFRALAEKLVIERLPKSHPIASVGETIFPDSLYRFDGPAWSPDMEMGERKAIEERSGRLFAEYRALLPLIAKSRLNHWNGTYFGRLVDWKGYNQLEYWLEVLRKRRAQGVTKLKATNLAVAGEGELGVGGQLHASSDKKLLGGPCLVHLDLSLLGGQLHLMATYRHWHLQQRALGNLVGLANLLRFVAHQTGYPPGELVVVSGVASAQHDEGKEKAISLARALRTGLQP